MPRAARAGATTLDSRASTSCATAGLTRSRGDVDGTAASATCLEGSTAASESGGTAEGNWLAALDDFRNYLICAA